MSNKKVVKFKVYKIPRDRHFLFVKNPWPFNDSMSTSRNPQAYCNEVVGWILCMLQDLCDLDIPPTHVRLFWQSTHREIIADIEVPANCRNLDPVLGAHHSCAFLTDTYAGDDNHTSVVYVYDYERFNSPMRTNWTEATPKYTRLHPDFPIKSLALSKRAYPTPSPADARKLPNTKPLPGRLVFGHPDCIAQTLALVAPPPHPQQPHPNDPPVSLPPQVVPPPAQPQPTPRAHSPPPEPNPPSEFAFTPYERPPNFPRGHPLTSDSAPPKRDPYDEEVAALARLREGSLAEEEAVRVKLEWEGPDEEQDEARAASTVAASETARPSLINPPDVRIKREAKVEYEPSQALMQLAAEVNRVRPERELRVAWDPPSAQTAQGDGACLAVHQGNAPLKREEIKTEDEPSQAFRERLEEANNVLRHRQRSEGPVVGAGAAVADPVRAIKPEPTDTLPGAVNDGGVLKQEEDGGMSKLPFIKPEPEDAPMPPPRTPIKRIEPDSTPRRVKEEGGQDLKPSVKPEPVDVPMPRPRAPNKRMDPFEPEATPSIVVKQEAGREFNTRQPPPGTAHPPSAYLRAPTPRIKQEERVSYPHAQRTASRPYYADPRQQSGFGRQEYGYGGTVNRASWQPPAPISFPRGDSDPSKTNHNSSYSNRRTPAPHNYSAPAREDTRSYSRQPSRTFSPPPRPVKRERDADDDSRPYRPAYEPPVKRERSESTDIRFNYSASHDPRMRARLGDQRERDASKRTKTE